MAANTIIRLFRHNVFLSVENACLRVHARYKTRSQLHAYVRRLGILWLYKNGTAHGRRAAYARLAMHGVVTIRSL